jgi:uncharacterized protein (TIGR04552 family)
MRDELTLPRYRRLDELDLLDLENIRLVLRGGSVIDWQRVAFESPEDVREFLVAHELDPHDPASHARMEAIKNHAIAYLRRNFEFPVPKPIAEADVAELLLIASGRGHRQLCACTILKVIHVIHHLEARELLSMLPVSDQDVFHLVEQKVYRVIGGMLARGLPILEFVGGRKNKDSLYSKLLSKRETHAAQIYDKLRFRIVVRSAEDIFPVLGYLTRHLFPFNYAVPGESTNTMFDLPGYIRAQGRLAELAPSMQPLADDEDAALNDNVFSAPSYRVVHFVVDMPVRLAPDMLEGAPPAAWALGHVVFAQAEFQLVDRETEQRNELGDASHDAYKARQKEAVMRRIKVGAPGKRPLAPPPQDPVNKRRTPGLEPEREEPRSRAPRVSPKTSPAPRASVPPPPRPASPTKSPKGPRVASPSPPQGPKTASVPPRPAAKLSPSSVKAAIVTATPKTRPLYDAPPRAGELPKVRSKLRRNFRPKR